MVLIFLLGFPFEWIEICLIVLPVFAPILAKLRLLRPPRRQARIFMAWFGTLVAVNLQTSFMTPPFGATLFYLKGTVPPGVTMADVYRAMYPFVAIQVHRPAPVHRVPGHRAVAAAGRRAARLIPRPGGGSSRRRDRPAATASSPATGT